MAADNTHPDASGALTPSELELIAELVDGVLDEDGRRAALRLLSESSAAYEVYADAVASLRGTGHDTEPSVAEGPVPARAAESPESPGGRPRGLGARLSDAVRGAPWWRTALPVAVAAGLAVLLTLPRDAKHVPDLAAALGTQTLAAGLDAAHPLGSARGATIPATDLGRSFRLGVRMMDTEARILTRRLDEARVSSQTALDLMQALEAPATVIVPFRDYVDRADPEGRSSMEEGIEAWLASIGAAALVRYRFGKSAESLRFALVAGDARLIRASSRDVRGVVPDELPQPTRDSVAVLIELASLDASADTARARMVALLSEAMVTAAR